MLAKVLAEKNGWTQKQAAAFIDKLMRLEDMDVLRKIQDAVEAEKPRQGPPFYTIIGESYVTGRSETHATGLSSDETSRWLESRRNDPEWKFRLQVEL